MKYKVVNEEFRYVSVWPLVVLCLLSVLGLIAGAWVISGQRIPETVTQIDTVTTYVLADTLEFTEANFMMVMEDLGVIKPNVAFGQARIESNNFKSKIFIENNNMFGFRVAPRTWEGTQLPFTNRGHSCFSGWVSCVIHYKRWQDSRITDDRWIDNNIVNSGFAEDPEYSKKLKAAIR
jgi:hypothetical protein